MTKTIVAGAALLALAACGDQSASNVKVGDNAASKGPMSAREVAREVAQVKLTPGQWRVESEVVEVDTPGMPDAVRQQMIGRKTAVEICIKPEDVERPDVFSGQQNDDCTYADFTMRGGRMSGTMTCKGGAQGGSMSMQMDGRYAPDRYDITTDMKMAGGDGQAGMAIKARASGARIGECTATKG